MQALLARRRFPPVGDMTRGRRGSRKLPAGFFPVLRTVQGLQTRFSKVENIRRTLFLPLRPLQARHPGQELCRRRGELGVQAAQFVRPRSSHQILPRARKECTKHILIEHVLPKDFNQIENQTHIDRIESGRIESGQVKSGQVKSSQKKSNRIKKKSKNQKNRYGTLRVGRTDFCGGRTDAHPARAGGGAGARDPCFPLGRVFVWEK